MGNYIITALYFHCRQHPPIRAYLQAEVLYKASLRFLFSINVCMPEYNDNLAFQARCRVLLENPFRSYDEYGQMI
jgi:hypothetical protein